MGCRRLDMRESLCGIRLGSAQCAQTSREVETFAQAATCVAMMQPADHREGDDLPPIGGLALAVFGGVLVEREVGPGAVIVLEVLAQDAKRGLWERQRSRWKREHWCDFEETNARSATAAFADAACSATLWLLRP